MPFSDLSLELGGWIDGRVDVAPESGLRGGKGIGDLHERNIAHDEHVHVAAASQLPARRGTEDKGRVDPGGEGNESLADDVHETGGLHQQRLKLAEHRGIAVGLEVHLSSLDRPHEKACFGELPELALDGAVRAATLPHELAQVELLLGMGVEPAKQPAPREAEEDGAGIHRSH